MWFNKKLKTDNELQAELKALVDVVIAQGRIFGSDANKYEQLLREIYNRGLEPAAKLVPKND